MPQQGAYTYVTVPTWRGGESKVVLYLRIKPVRGRNVYNSRSGQTKRTRPVVGIKKKRSRNSKIRRSTRKKIWHAEATREGGKIGTERRKNAGSGGSVRSRGLMNN